MSIEHNFNRFGFYKDLSIESMLYKSLFYILNTMTQLNQVYKCSVCGNMTEVVHAGGGTLVCCGKDMLLMADDVKPEISTEKHTPIVERDGNTVTVTV